MATQAISLGQLSLLFTLRRSLSACVGSPFGFLRPVIRPSLGYIHAAAPIGRRAVGAYGFPNPDHRGLGAAFPASAEVPTTTSQLAFSFMPAPPAIGPP